MALPAPRFIPILVASFLAGPALLPTAATAQDDALKRLLKKMDPPPANPDADQDKPALDDQDKDVDSALQRLLEREDRPDTQGRAAPPPADQPPSGVAPEQDDLDAHLRRLMGRIDPKKDQDQQQSDQGGPMSDTMKKMREAEQRLAKLDTGEETREVQEQIVKDLDKVLERIQQMRQQQQMQQGQGKPTEMAGQQPGQQNQNGDPNSDRGGGAPPVQPDLPPQPNGLANAKDTWGHLQGALREVMGNVSRMLPLEAKEELIERYFLSVAKGSVARSGGEEE